MIEPEQVLDTQEDDSPKMEIINTKWKSQRAGFLDSLEYMSGRKEGIIKSFRTPWSKFNDATTDGIEWNTMTVIAGRPGNYKTCIKDQLIREGFKLNLGENFRVLEFQLEMLARTSAIREYSSALGKTYKYLCSADGMLTAEDLDKCYEYAKARIVYPIDVVEEPCTVEEFKTIIHEYMKAHSIIVEGVRKYVKTVITLDHTILLKVGKGEKSKMDMLYNLGEAITELKRIYPIAFIILSQLNRGIDSAERSEEGKYGNYVLESDIFGADAMLMHTDTLIGLNRPAKQKIRFYGPDRYIIENDSILVMHFLKCRNGDNRMSFFRADGTKMTVTEINTPPTADRRSK